MLQEFQTGRRAIERSWGEGRSGEMLLVDQTQLVDRYISTCFQKIQELFGETGVAVVALGGYGRSELYPYSDIDLMVLYHPKLKKHVGKIADLILYPLWDTKLEVGHGVRTIKESISHAREEYLFRVALLDARLLCGDATLFEDLQKEYRKKFVDGCREAFVKEMKDRRAERRARFGSHSYLLEPHIKEGRGGMRDIQAMFWTSRVVFGLVSLVDIEDAGLLLPEEKQQFVSSYDMLVRLRTRLHYVSGRKNDQLHFEQQADMAEAFGYTGTGAILPVEAFMRDLYGHLQNVARVTDLFFDHIDEALGLDDRQSEVQDKQVEPGVDVRKGNIHLTANRQQIEAKPHILIRVFLAMARTGLPLHYRTRKAIALYVHLISNKVRLSPRLNKALVSILLEAKDVFPVLEVMLETGMLPACIPEFSQIVSLAQHDLYHIYTVDRHSLQAVAELRSVVDEQPAVAGLVENPSVLYLAALLHDIAKGTGHDHSEEGARIVFGIGQRLGLTDEDCQDLKFLVMYHLFLPESALRRDLNDVVFIQRCAEVVQTIPRLAMLYLLSVADSRATGPSAWSEWKASLLHEMYFKVLSGLEHALEEASVGDLQRHVEDGVDWLRGRVQDLLVGEPGAFNQEILPADYLLAFAPEVVVEHIRLYHAHYRVLRQKSFVQAYEDDGEWKLLLMSTDRPGLLAKICGVLALHNLAVVRAQIFTWVDGTVVDVVTVRPLETLDFGEKNWQGLNDDMDLALAHRLDLGHKLYQKWSTTYGRKYELTGNVESRVVVDNESSDVYSIVEVYAVDRPYLLYHLAQTLADFGINIYKAYIATEVEQLIDVFYVLDARGEKLIASSFQEEVVQSLLGFLGTTAS